jgi:hypothetical protein
MKHEKTGATAPTSEDSSWLDGKAKTSVQVHVDLPKVDVPKLVKVLSMRPGDVVLKDGTRLKYKKVLDVTEDVAEWLFKSFPGLMEKL